MYFSYAKNKKQKTKKFIKKINLLNHPLCGKAAREEFRETYFATVLRLIPYRTKRRCHIPVRSGRAIPGALRFSLFCTASAVYIKSGVNKNRFSERSQRRHRRKDDTTKNPLNHPVCGKAAREEFRGAYISM